MKILLKRSYKGALYTIGKLYIDGKYFCDTLEDPVRDLPTNCPNTPKGKDCACKEKAYGNTAIPAGEYKITMEMSPRFKKVLPRLHNVQHFIGILMHSGNDHEDTHGCILVGKNKIRGKVLDSVATTNELCAILEKEKEISITVI